MNNWFYFSQAPLVVKQPANSNGFEGMNVGGGCHQRHLLPQRLRLPGRELGANGLCRRGLVKRHLGPRSWELKSVFFKIQSYHVISHLRCQYIFDGSSPLVMSGADLVTEIPIQRFDVHQWYGFPNFCQQFL